MGYYSRRTIRKRHGYVTNSSYRTFNYIEYMSIWSKLIGVKNVEDRSNIIDEETTSLSNSFEAYAIIDVEVDLKGHKIHDIGALKHDDTIFHKTSKEELFVFLNDIDYICGHNIIHHDAKYLFTDKICRWTLVDTCYISQHRLHSKDSLVYQHIVDK